MSSIRCQSCGLVNFAEAEKCKRCNEPLASAPFGIQPGTSVDSKEQSSADQIPRNASKEGPSDSRPRLKILPLVAFGVLLLLVLKDRMFDPPVKVGGYTDTLQWWVMVGCTIGLIVTVIVIAWSRKK
jgi:hypothetical protein